MQFTFDHLGEPRMPYERYQDEIGSKPAIWSEDYNRLVLTRYADLRKVLSNRQAFTSAGGGTQKAFGAQAMLVDDTFMHNRVRAVWADATSEASMAMHGEMIEDVVNASLSPTLLSLESGKSADLVTAFRKISGGAVLRLMGISSERMDEFVQWNEAISQSTQLEFPPDHPRFTERDGAKRAAYALLSGEVSKRLARLDMPDDLVSLMARAEGEEGITSSMVLDNLLNLFIGAFETTTRWLGNIVVRATKQPELWDQIKGERSLIPGFIEEVQRYEPVIQLLSRRVAEDGLVLHGHKLAVGEEIYMLVGFANRDTEVFENPDVFDPHRIDNRHFGFGFGFHNCLGKFIARAEVNTTLNYLLDRNVKFDIVDISYGSNSTVWGPTSLRVISKH